MIVTEYMENGALDRYLRVSPLRTVFSCFVFLKGRVGAQNRILWELIVRARWVVSHKFRKCCLFLEGGYFIYSITFGP